MTRVLAAYLLAVLGGNAEPSAADITKILGSVGIEANADELTAVLAQLKGKDVNALIAQGSSKLASVPSGGAVAAAPAAGGAAAGGKADAKKEDKKEEKKPEPKKEEKKEESDEDMGFGLFD
jgi:large subunit ribosomal protein LP2